MQMPSVSIGPQSPGAGRMPNLVAYLQVRLNLKRAEDEEIYRNLTKMPEGERSRMVRVALLAYFKGEITGEERRAKRAKIRQAEIGPGERTRAIPAIVAEAAQGAIDHESQPTTTKKDSGAALNDMLDLIQ